MDKVTYGADGWPVVGNNGHPTFNSVDAPIVIRNEDFEELIE